MDHEWELIEDAIIRKFRLVQNFTGLIVGQVSCITYDQRAGWYAATDGPEGRKRLGDFVTEELAKKAVEAAQLQPITTPEGEL